jgi:hypothetical protein
MLTLALQNFIQQASGAIEALETMGAKLEADLRGVLQYYGEDPTTTKPEDLFGTIVTFSSALLVRLSPAPSPASGLTSVRVFVRQRAESEVKAVDKKLSPPTCSAPAGRPGSPAPATSSRRQPSVQVGSP